jgi:hypothetical protein
MAYEKPEHFATASLQILVASVENKEQATQLHDDYRAWLGRHPLTEYGMTLDELVKFNIGNTLALEAVREKKTAGIWRELGIEHPILGAKVETLPDDIIGNMHKLIGKLAREGKSRDEYTKAAKEYIAQAEQVIKDGES